MERDGFLILGEDYGCARPLKLTQAFLDDLDSHDVFRLWSREKAELHMIHGEADRTIPILQARRLRSNSASRCRRCPAGITAFRFQARRSGCWKRRCPFSGRGRAARTAAPCSSRSGARRCSPARSAPGAAGS